MKLLAFIKQNKIIVLALLIVLLSFGLLALPGQFAHYGPLNLSSKVASERFAFRLSGYEWIFATAKTKLDAKIGTVSAQGVATIVLLGLCVPGLLFSKKSSFVALLTSLALITVAVLFLSISAAGPKSYPDYHIRPADNGYSLMLWVPYVIGGLTLVAGGLMTYHTVIVMKNEVKSPSQTKGSSYSYLKNK